MEINNEFTFGDHVIVKTDPDQSVGIVTAIVVLPNDLLRYMVSVAGEEAGYYAFELTKHNTQCRKAAGFKKT